jgi:hypothetical protein
MVRINFSDSDPLLNVFFYWFYCCRCSIFHLDEFLFLDEGPEEFLALFPKFMAVRKSATNDDLYILTDKRVAALDQSLSELNLFDR